MAKRQRGSAARPGQRPSTTRAAARPTTRPATRPDAPSRPASLTDDELSRAAALEAMVVEEEKAAAANLARGRDRRRATATDDTPRARTRSAGALAAVAADEYTVVRRDLRRIAAVFGLIFALLLASFVLVQVLGIAQPPTSV